MQAGELLKQARTSAGLTQAQLARILGISQPEIARLESPVSNPRIATLERAVGATGQSLTLALEPGPGIDESLIAESLRFNPSERLRHFEFSYASARQLAGRAFAARGS